MERPTLIIVEDAAHGRAVVQDHGTRRIRLGSGRVGRDRGRRHGGLVIISWGGPRRRDPLSLEHGLFDRPQAAHLLAHLDLGVAVGLQNRLGHITELSLIHI